jgi:pyruvate dehydrogenase E2 component (dihydrolipoamide acetyltransferase)
MAGECTVPVLGENVESATVVEVFVKPGDVIRREQAVLSLETDKAEFEMPSNVDGAVTEILVQPGDEVRVGQVVLRVDDASAAAGQKSAPGRAPAAKAAESTSAARESEASEAVAAKGEAESPRGKAPLSRASSAPGRPRPRRRRPSRWPARSRCPTSRDGGPSTSSR